MQRFHTYSALLGVAWLGCAAGQALNFLTSGPDKTSEEQTLVVHGAGDYVDGRYALSSRSVGNRGCYVKQAPEDVNVCRGPGGFWLAQPQSAVGQDVGYMMSRRQYAADPSEAGPWSTYKAGTWHEAKFITVVRDVESVSMTVAVVGLGGLVTSALLLMLAWAKNPAVREAWYCVLGATFTTLQSFTAFLIWKDLVPALPGSPFKNLIFGIVLFSGSYAFMTYGSWKCQYDFHRLSGICSSAAYAAAYAGITTVTALQRLTANITEEYVPKKGWPMPFQRPSSERVIPSGWVAPSGLVVVTVLAVVASVLLPEATKMLRSWYMMLEPEVLWCTKPLMVLRGTCVVPCWKGQQDADEPVSTDFDWKEYVDWGEEVVASLIGSFAVNSLLMFLFTQQLLDADEPLYPSSKSWRGFYIASGVAFMCVIIAGIKAYLSDLYAESSRVRILTLSFGKMGIWSTYRLLTVGVAWFCAVSDLKPIVTAFIATPVSAVLVFMLGTWTNGVNSSAGVNTLALGIGNVCGLAWGNMLHGAGNSAAASLASSVGLQDSIAADSGIPIVMSCILVSVMGAVWWKIILPRRNLQIADHSSIIQGEARAFSLE